MEQVTMRKEQLLEVLQQNRENHQELFVEAHEMFVRKAIENLESRLNMAKTGKIDLHVELVEPEDHTDQYDRAIEMLDYEVNDEVTLSQHEFAQLVMDNWGWMPQFSSTYTNLTGKAAITANMLKS